MCRKVTVPRGGIAYMTYMTDFITFYLQACDDTSRLTNARLVSMGLKIWTWCEQVGERQTMFQLALFEKAQQCFA